MGESSECKIRIYDPNFNWLNETHQAESVQFTRELYGTGLFEIHIHPDKNGTHELITKDNIIVINRDGYKAGIIQDFILTENRQQQEYVITGYPADALTKRRITVPPAEAQIPGSLGWDRINASAETVLKHYAAMNMITPFDANRVIPRLRIAADGGRGASYPWQTRYEPLDEVLAAAGEYGEMGYAIYADVQGKSWVFDVIPGIDRSQRQDAVSPVMFSMTYHNIGDYRYAEDRKQYRNCGYAGGAGEDEKRLLYVLGAENKGLDRNETFLDCGNAADIDELIYYGAQKMSELSEIKSIEAGALPRTFLYGVDYFLGDMVTVVIARLNKPVDIRITSVKNIWEQRTGHTTEVRFGTQLPNIFTILNKSEVVR